MPDTIPWRSCSICHPMRLPCIPMVSSSDSRWALTDGGLANDTIHGPKAALPLRRATAPRG
jgi:hypothetical protein